MTKEYLKMADGFKSGSKWFGDALREETGAADELINSAVHAIDSHDELVAEVERLRVVVDGVISASKSMQDRKPLTPWGDGFKECAASIERAISGVMSGELSVFPRDL